MFVTLTVIFLLVALDRFTKVCFAAFLAERGSVVLIPKLLGLHLLHGGNTGAAFGMLEGKTLFLSLMSIVVIAVLLYVLLFKRFKSPLLKWSVVLITAGGIGNLYDRIVYGSVTDFIEFLFIDFPVFNVADCYITVAVTAAIAYLIFTFKDDTIFLEDEKQKNENGAEEQGEQA